MMAYNNVVSVYLHPRNTQETKTYIRRLLIAFEKMVSNIDNNIIESSKIINSNNNINNNNNNDDNNINNYSKNEKVIIVK